MSVKQEIDVQSLWAEYEKIAMHFNDLLMRLRSQSLAGIAAISTVVGIFSKESNIAMDWLVAQAIFMALGAFWIAVWCLDMLYYNRLLIGAVEALHQLEKQTKAQKTFDGYINMSTLIEAEFLKPVWSLRRPRFIGIVAFYVIVFGLIVAGAVFSWWMR